MTEPDLTEARDYFIANYGESRENFVKELDDLLTTCRQSGYRAALADIKQRLPPKNTVAPTVGTQQWNACLAAVNKVLDTLATQAGGQEGEEEQ